MQRQFLAAAIVVALAACSTTAPPEAAVANKSASIAVGASPAPPADSGSRRGTPSSLSASVGASAGHAVARAKRRMASGLR